MRLFFDDFTALIKLSNPIMVGTPENVYFSIQSWVEVTEESLNNGFLSYTIQFKSLKVALILLAIFR
jgi:hypothetical protein